MISRRTAYAVRVATVAAVYYGAAKLGLGLAFATPSVTAVWAPTGIALAAVLLWGFRIWPGVALGALLANAWTGVPFASVLGIAAGNTLEAVVGAYLLMRFAGFRPSLERVRDVGALVVLAAVVSTAVSATIGVTSLLAGNEIDAGDYGSVWRTWWLGDMGGDLLVAPAILVAATHWPFRRLPGRALEAAGLAVVVAGVAVLAFTREVPVLFLLFPPLIVAAYRFWQPGAVSASLLVAAVAIPLTEQDIGPFAGSSPDERLLLAQAFVGIASLTTLVLAAVMTERQRAEDAVGAIAETLQRSLLPTSKPEIPGIETAVESRPAGERQLIGGDFYDLFEGHDGALGVVVGDVRGKDASAAATTALARYTLRAAAVHEHRPHRVLDEVNSAIRRQSPGQSCTAVYARMERDDGAARVVLSLAGHPLPLLLRGDGTVETLGRPAVPLGLEPHPGFVDDGTTLGRGDALLIYTDGLTDAYAPRRFVRPSELAATLGTAAGRSATGIADRILEVALGSGRGKPRDDLLVLVLRIPR